MTMRTPVLLVGISLCLAPAARAQSPMVIVNGVRVERCDGASGRDLAHLNLNDIDPAVIENVEVLKGALAVQQYGTDASSGVIVISTKKGSVVSPTTCGATAAAGANSFGKYLYSPEFVMAHQEAISLTDGQRTAIQDAVREIQSKTIVDTQFKLASATERLTRALARPSIDEAAVLQQVDETLALEREVKRAQMTLLVRIKNQLTAQQQKVLDKLRSP
jgi:TonB-dependent SusC/RagA subfamily outer membrane receptor